MLKRIFLPSAFVFVLAGALALAASVKPDDTESTQEKLISSGGAAVLKIDLNFLRGDKARQAEPIALEFGIAPQSFFTALVTDKTLRTIEPGSMLQLLPTKTSAALPAALRDSLGRLVLERMSYESETEFVVRDGVSGAVFFQINGAQIEFDPISNALALTDGSLLLAPDFAKALGREAAALVPVGTVEAHASMALLERIEIAKGEVNSVALPPQQTPPGTDLVGGPDVIVGDLPSLVQSGSGSGQVGLAVATTSCNNGAQQLNWQRLPDNDHPVIPQNLYRMSGGTSNADRFEQIGQSWLKHAFTALQQNVCGFGCTASGTGTRLGVGCSDPYSTSLNGDQTSLGSRAWVNPFTGAFPRGDDPVNNPDNHSGHTHSGASHRIAVNTSDLNTTLNTGATYYAEAQYVTPHEYAWCSTHAGECNMYNNVSYRRFNVTGTTSFTFASVGATVRMTPAIYAWTGASIQQFEPAPGQDGIGFVAVKVSGPTGGLYHYEYAIYNQNLDRAIRSFNVPLGCGATVSNAAFRAPANEAAFANDGTLNSAGFSNAAWTATSSIASLEWATQTFAQNQNANALRWGSLYNFRFDSPRPPRAAQATLGFFKTGNPILVNIQAPTPDQDGVCDSAKPILLTTVDDHADGICSDADCTLREAITAANTQTGQRTITASAGLNGAVQLTSALPAIGTDLSISGPGASLLTIRRNSGGNYRIVTISNGTNSGPSVSIQGVTIANGFASGAPFPADSGGGILNDRGSLLVRDCVLSGNSAAGGSGRGGAIFNNEGNLTVDRSTLSGNSAYSGGAIANRRADLAGESVLTVSSSTLSGNTASLGNGIHDESAGAGRTAALNTLLCTFSANSGGAGNLGGGIYNTASNGAAANVAVTHSTFAGNNAEEGSGIYNLNSGGTASATLRNSIFVASAGSSFSNNGGSITSLGYNLASDSGSGILGSAGDQAKTDPRLAPLANNGGPTQTHALLGDSSCLDRGYSFGATVDQRGQSRVADSPVFANAPGGDGTDIGAFEVNPFGSTIDSDANGLPNEFEIFFGVNDPNADGDGDGFSNRYEYLAGTSPLSSQSALRVLSTDRRGNDAIVTFYAVAGRSYRLEHKDSIADSQWLNISGLTDLTAGTTGNAQFIHPNGMLSLGKVYRVRLLLP